MPSVERRGKHWWVRYTVKNADGKATTVRRGPYATRREAELEAQGAPDVPTLVSHALHGYRVREQELALGSGQEDRFHKLKLYCGRLERHLGHVRLDRLTTTAINNVWATMVKTLSRKTVTNHRSVLVQALDAVVDHTGGVNRARASKVPRKPGGKGVVARPHFETDELQRLSDWLAGDDSRWALPGLVVVWTACRRGEALGLRVMDVLPDGRIHIGQQLKDVRTADGERIAEPRPTKTEASVRDVELPGWVHERLVKLAEGRFGAELLFGTCHPDGFGQWFSRVACRDAGVRALSLHSVRHGLASTLVQAGVDVASVSKLLGHSTVATTTRVYVHGSSTPLRASVIEAAMLGEGGGVAPVTPLGKVKRKRKAG